MECTIEEVGMGQCLCPECQAGWATFVEYTARQASLKRCRIDPDCQCDDCNWGRVATDGFSIEELLGAHDGQLKIIARSAGYSNRVVGFELVNGACWVWDYPRGHWDETPSFVVPATRAGMAQIEEYFAYCL